MCVFVWGLGEELKEVRERVREIKNKVRRTDINTRNCDVPNLPTREKVANKKLTSFQTH